MEKNYEQRRKEVLDVCHIEKQLYEIPIPGMEAYTIDGEMVLRSYKRPGPPAILLCRQNKHGGHEYNLWCIDENGLRQKKSFSPLRLYLCACAGLDPRVATLDSFEYDEQGFPVAVKMKVKDKLKRMPGKVITTNAYRKTMTDKEKQMVVAARSMHELQVLQSCIETEDYSELMEIMWSYKTLVISMLYVRYGIRTARAKELYSIAVEHLIQRIKRDHVVIRNILWGLIHTAYLAKLNNA